MNPDDFALFSQWKMQQQQQYSTFSQQQQQNQNESQPRSSQQSFHLVDETEDDEEEAGERKRAVGCRWIAPVGDSWLTFVGSGSVLVRHVF
ncbi:hypothetical protein Tco_1240388 [Tanacetum coccineum]